MVECVYNITINLYCQRVTIIYHMEIHSIQLFCNEAQLVKMILSIHIVWSFKYSNLHQNKNNLKKKNIGRNQKAWKILQTQANSVG